MLIGACITPHEPADTLWRRRRTLSVPRLESIAIDKQHIDWSISIPLSTSTYPLMKCVTKWLNDYAPALLWLPVSSQLDFCYRDSVLTIGFALVTTELCWWMTQYLVTMVKGRVSLASDVTTRDAHARYKRKSNWDMSGVKLRFFWPDDRGGLGGGVNIILRSLMTGEFPVMYGDQHDCLLPACPDIFISTTKVKVSM